MAAQIVTIETLQTAARESFARQYEEHGERFADADAMPSLMSDPFAWNELVQNEIAAFYGLRVTGLYSAPTAKVADYEMRNACRDLERALPEECRRLIPAMMYAGKGKEILRDAYRRVVWDDTAPVEVIGGPAINQAKRDSFRREVRDGTNTRFVAYGVVDRDGKSYRVMVCQYRNGDVDSAVWPLDGRSYQPWGTDKLPGIHAAALRSYLERRYTEARKAAPRVVYAVSYDEKGERHVYETRADYEAAQAAKAAPVVTPEPEVTSEPVAAVQRYSVELTWNGAVCFTGAGSLACCADIAFAHIRDNFAGSDHVNRVKELSTAWIIRKASSGEEARLAWKDETGAAVARVTKL